MLTDEKGSIAETYKYGTYGELSDGNAGLTVFLYIGQYGVMTDDNGLYYMRARYYDSSMKRFINRDIVTETAEDSRSLNRYAYCYGNPVSYTDPFGLSPLISLRNYAVLDVIGLLPVIGVVADLTNAVLYLAEGNIGAAAVSVVFAVVPTTFAGRRGTGIWCDEDRGRCHTGGCRYRNLYCGSVYQCVAGGG